MHSSAVLALALVAAAGPALGAPAAPFHKRQAASSVAPVASSVATAPAVMMTNVSGALDTELISDIIKIGDGLIDGANGIKQLFT